MFSLYLDGLEITNNDGNYYKSEDIPCENAPAISGSWGFYEKYESPLVINGIANIHICDDSTINAVNDIVTVNGEMNIIESKKWTMISKRV